MGQDLLSTCNSLCDDYEPLTFEGKNMGDLDKILNKIYINNVDICSKCDGEKVVAVSYFSKAAKKIFKDQNKYQVESRDLHDKILEIETTRSKGISNVQIFYKFGNIIIAAKPDIITYEKNKITVREITTINPFLMDEDSIYYIIKKLSDKRTQVMIYSYILSKLFPEENKIYYSVEAYIGDSINIDPCKVEYLLNLTKEYINKYRGHIRKVLRDPINVKNYRMIFNNTQDVSIPMIIIKEEFNDGKRSYVEGILSEAIKSKVFESL